MSYFNDTAFSTLKALLSTACTLCMMASITDFNQTRKKICTTFAIYLVYVVLSSYFIIHFTSWYVLSKVFILTISIPAVLVTWWLAKDSPSQAIFNYLTQVNFSLFVVITCTLLSKYMNLTPGVDLLIRLCSYGLIIFIEYRFIRKPFRYINDTLQHNWLLLSVLPVTFFACLWVNGMYPTHFIKDPDNIVPLYVTFLAMTIIYLLIFKILFNITSLMQKAREKELLKAQVAALKQQAEITREQERQLTVLRHNMRHSLLAVESLYKDNQPDKAQAFLQHAESELLQPISQRYCENNTLNALFLSVFSHLEDEGIRLDTAINLPSHLPVDEFELSVVLANIIENAKIACASVPDGEKFITVKCMQKPQFLIVVTNSYRGDILLNSEGFPMTRKKNHGIGTLSIRSFVNQHNGFLDYDITEDTFSLRILLK